MATLDPLRFRDRCTQTDGEIIREVIAADGDRAGVAHHPTAENEQFGGAAADVQEAAAEIAFILRQTGFRGSQRLKDGIADEDAGLVGGRNKILSSGNGRSDQMNVHFQALADHTDSVAYAILRIYHELVGKDVQDFAVFGKRDVAGSVHGAAHVFALDVARTMSQSDAAAAVYATHVAPGHSDERFFDRHIRDAFGFFDRAADGTHRGIKIDDQALAQSLGLRRAERQKFHQFAFDFRD